MKYQFYLKTFPVMASRNFSPEYFAGHSNLNTEHTDPGSPEMRKLAKMRDNLLKGMEVCLEIAGRDPYPGENLASLEEAVHNQRARLDEISVVVA
jgi:hypothetical protein